MSATGGGEARLLKLEDPPLSPWAATLDLPHHLISCSSSTYTRRTTSTYTASIMSDDPMADFLAREKAALGQLS